MGQCASSELPHRSPEEETINCENLACGSRYSKGISSKGGSINRISASSWVSNRLLRRPKSKDLSAAFNILNQEIKSNLVNINLASEEELMTLQGINRQLAKNIIDYRNALGGFRRLEDLALVSGIGALLLQDIKNDITLKRHPSYTSSRTQSFDSIPSCESLKSHRSNFSVNGCSLKTSPIKRINVNSASIFDLMNIKGMNQEMAANIVHYRSKHGAFKHLDELVRVKGINYRILGLLQAYLNCSDIPQSSPLLANDSVSITSQTKKRSFIRPKFACHRRSHSAPSQSEEPQSVEHQLPTNYNQADHRFSSEFSADLFELLSLRSERPSSREVFNGTYHGHSAIRIGTWNLQRLTLEKIKNPGVLEVICRTILETGFSILALQEIADPDVLSEICCELNCGRLRRIREWSGPKGEWKWEVCKGPFVSANGTEYAAFIYNGSHGVHLITSTLLQFNNNNNCKVNSAFLSRKPFLGYFKAHDLELVLVNIHWQTKRNKRSRIMEEEDLDHCHNVMDSSAVGGEEKKNIFDPHFLSPVISALRGKLDSQKFIVLLGSFNLLHEDSAFNILKENCFCQVIPWDVPSDISYDRPEGNECLDNIWLSANCQKLLAGTWGVVREGLSHMAIPRGWGWGGMVSDHCPIYCDLYTVVPLSPKIAKPVPNSDVKYLLLNGN